MTLTGPSRTIVVEPIELPDEELVPVEGPERPPEEAPEPCEPPAR